MTPNNNKDYTKALVWIGLGMITVGLWWSIFNLLYKYIL